MTMTFGGQLDPFGNPIVSVPEFGRLDADSRPYVAPPMIGGVAIRDMLDMKDRRDAVKRLTDAGFKIPNTVTNAIAVYDRVLSYTVDVPVPSITGMTPDEAYKALDDYVTLTARQPVVPRAKELLVVQAHSHVVDLFRSMTGDVLSHIRPEFEQTAEQFASEFEHIRGVRGVTEAATADQTGETLRHWWGAVNKSTRLTELSDLPLLCIKPEGKSGARYRDAAPLIRALGTDTLVVLSDYVELGKHDEAAPFGIFSFVLDAGGSISLPADPAEWYDRARNPWERDDFSVTFDDE
jgi:hypothetical protein